MHDEGAMKLTLGRELRTADVAGFQGVKAKSAVSAVPLGLGRVMTRMQGLKPLPILWASPMGTFEFVSSCGGMLFQKQCAADEQSQGLINGCVILLAEFPVKRFLDPINIDSSNFSEIERRRI